MDRDRIVKHLFFLIMLQLCTGIRSTSPCSRSDFVCNGVFPAVFLTLLRILQTLHVFVSGQNAFTCTPLKQAHLAQHTAVTFYVIIMIYQSMVSFRNELQYVSYLI